MELTLGIGDGILKKEARVTYLNIDLIHEKKVDITYEIGMSVKTIKISLEKAIEIGFLNIKALKNYIN